MNNDRYLFMGFQLGFGMFSGSAATFGLVSLLGGFDAAKPILIPIVVGLLIMFWFILLGALDKSK
jgi:hypothetical protein